MATVKKGILTTTGEWWKHLRSKKRTFWKGERRAAKMFTREEQALYGKNSDASK
jgi:hypothetical protein